MWSVYIIRSINFPKQEYIGATTDLKRRVSDHNVGKSTHTNKFKPWKLIWYCAFPDKTQALAFEKYLKSLRAGIRQEAADRAARSLPLDPALRLRPRPNHA